MRNRIGGWIEDGWDRAVEAGPGEGGPRAGGGAAAEEVAGPVWWPLEEPYEGATALEDLAAAAGDLGATRRILARYAVLRVVLRAVRGSAQGTALAEERAIAGQYVRVTGGVADAERLALTRVIALAAPRFGPMLCGALNDAGDQARLHGAVMGGFSLHRASYRLAVLQGWPVEADRAVEAVTRLALALRAGRDS